MKSALLILGVIVYNVCLFWIDVFWVLGCLLGVNLALVVILPKINWRAQCSFLVKTFGFVVFIVLTNLLFTEINQALLVSFRLGLALESTFIVSQLLDATAFAQGIVILLTPLKSFHFDTEAAALSITVALTMVPLLTREAVEIQDSLRLKGCGFKNLCRRPQVYVVGMVGRLFDYIESTEAALRLKGYE